MTEEISIAELLPEIKKGWKWIALISALCLILSVVYSIFFIPKTYTTTAKMIASFTTIDIDEKDKLNAISSSYITASEQLARTYSEVLTSEYTANAILEQLESSEYGWKGVTSNMVRGAITIVPVNETSVLQIGVTTVDPQLTKDICDIFTKVSPDIIYEKSQGRLLPLDAGQLPKAPSSPSVPKNAIIGLLAGFILSAGFIVIRHITDNKVNNPSDLPKRLQVPVLGTVPCFNSQKNKKSPAHGNADSMDVGRAQKNFGVIESYKNIRTNLLYTFAQSKSKVVVVTGAEAQAGKSITCANLAIAFAQNNCKVLVIDADMRKPVQQKLFKKENSDGLSRLLSGQTSFEESVKKNVVPGLDLLTSGPIPPNPSELLGTKTMSDLIEAVGEKYDFVIIDTPPANYVTDCLTVAGLVNGVVFVARQGHTVYPELSKAIDKIKTVDGKVSGVIVSDVKAADGYYKVYKEYVSEREAKS